MPPVHRETIDVPMQDAPLALAELHRVVHAGERAQITIVDDVDQPSSAWSITQLDDVFVGAGFADIDIGSRCDSMGDRGSHTVTATRARTLADTVGPGLRLLVCGLNPSLNAADAGVGFFKNGNRFWPAALASGLVTRDRDPIHALTHQGVGMTDIVKRATARADELDPDEFRTGMQRLERTVAWLQPAAVCFVGLMGWRTAVDRKAKPGVQPDMLGGRHVYVMPSTSGLNARSSLDDLTAHLRAAATLAGLR